MYKIKKNITIGFQLHPPDFKLDANDFFCLFDSDSLCPINNLSIKQGRVFLGWTSTKLR